MSDDAHLDAAKRLGRHVDTYAKIDRIANVTLGIAVIAFLAAFTMVAYYHGVPRPDLMAKFGETGQLPLINPFAAKQCVIFGLPVLAVGLIVKGFALILQKRVIAEEVAEGGHR